MGTQGNVGSVAEALKIKSGVKSVINLVRIATPQTSNSATTASAYQSSQTSHHA